jgi:hypothetical protein
VVLLDPGLRVYETRTGGATLNVPDEVGQPFVAVRFLEGERILAYRASPSGIEVLEASLGGGPISSRGRVDMALPFDLKLHPPRLRFDLREERVLIGAGSPPRFLLAPALGGSALRELETPPDAVAAEAAFLPEGGFVLAQALPRTSTLRFFADDGRPSGELDLARAARRLEVKAMGGGRVGVALRTSTWAESRLLVVDTGTRRVVREEEGLAFADAPAAPAGRPLLEGTGPSLVRYDVETGERRLLWSRASAR